MRAGHYNGDGYDDLIVGAYAYDGGKGRIYEFDGSSSGLDSAPSLWITGEDWQSLGRALFSLGDVEGDGYYEFATSDYLNLTVVVYSGSAKGIDPESETVLSNPDRPVWWYFGTLNDAGDLDGDTYTDLLVANEHALWTFGGWDVDSDGDGSGDGRDCADDDDTIFPGADEACDGI